MCRLTMAAAVVATTACIATAAASETTVFDLSTGVPDSRLLNRDVTFRGCNLGYKNGNMACLGGSVGEVLFEFRGIGYNGSIDEICPKGPQSQACLFSVRGWFTTESGKPVLVAPTIEFGPKHSSDGVQGPSNHGMVTIAAIEDLGVARNNEVVMVRPCRLLSEYGDWACTDGTRFLPISRRTTNEMTERLGNACERGSTDPRCDGFAIGELQRRNGEWEITDAQFFPAHTGDDRIVLRKPSAPILLGVGDQNGLLKMVAACMRTVADVGRHTSEEDMSIGPIFREEYERVLRSAISATQVPDSPSGDFLNSILDICLDSLAFAAESDPVRRLKFTTEGR